MSETAAIALLLLAGGLVTLIGLTRERKRPTPALDTPLIFTDGRAFFEYQCKYGVVDIVDNQAIIGLILDDITDVASRILPTLASDAAPGQQLVTALIASRSGGFKVTTYPAIARTTLRAGDVVAWVPLSYSDALSAWNGVITARLAPELGRDGFRILDRYA